MPVLNTKNATSTKKSPGSVADIIVRRNHSQQKNVPMLTADKVPAGTYRTVIVAVSDAQNAEGKPMADVIYRFTSVSGKAVEAKVRYPIEGYHIERLFDALIDAGLPEGSPLTDAVGIEEEDVRVVYLHKGALGTIKSRRPASNPTPQKSSHQRLTKRIEKAFDPEEFDDDLDDCLDDDDLD